MLIAPITTSFLIAFVRFFGDFFLLYVFLCLRFIMFLCQLSFLYHFFVVVAVMFIVLLVFQIGQNENQLQR